MANRMTEIRDQIIDKTPEDVEALLGRPKKEGRWTKMRPPQGATADQLATFRSSQLDKIWIYESGRVHFNLAGRAVNVDDDVEMDLPPDQNLG